MRIVTNTNLLFWVNLPKSIRNMKLVTMLGKILYNRQIFQTSSIALYCTVHTTNILRSEAMLNCQCLYSGKVYILRPGRVIGFNICGAHLDNEETYAYSVHFHEKSQDIWPLHKAKCQLKILDFRPYFEFPR